MVRREFGWTCVDVSVIGQGTWMIEGSHDKERRAVEALRLGFQLGLTHIDTAEMYGNGRAEELIAEAVMGRRDDVFLTSKVLPSNASYEGTLRACERSLKRLHTDILDLYLLHWQSSYPISETMRAMEHLVSTRMIRYIGVSNFHVDEVKAAQHALRHERLACNQVLYHLGDRRIERRLIPYCAEQGIAVVGYSPFGHGSFPRTDSPEGRLLAEIGERHGRTPRQVALNFLTRDPNVFTIPKTGDPSHVYENSEAIGWTLSPEEIEAIDRAFPVPARDTPLAMI
ncbi:MAG: aldo/keto reductase [Chloroflexi bacterium]|nr:aldo/keto reductase [Chloroflexota bacterium]